MSDEPAEASEPFAIPITGDLDLHPFSPRDVGSVVVEYVHECQRRGILRLRLAHGRGSGAQRALVRRVLAGMPEVLSARDAPAQAGGWGATIAELRPKGAAR